MQSGVYDAHLLVRVELAVMLVYVSLYSQGKDCSRMDLRGSGFGEDWRRRVA